MLTWSFFKHYLLSPRSGALIRTISWLSILGTGIGVLSLVLVLSIMNGFNRSIREKLLAVEPHLVVQPKDQQNENIYNSIVKNPGVEAYSYESQDVILKTMDGLFGGAVAKGLEEKALVRLIHKVTKSRKNSMEAEDVDVSPGEVVLGIDLARSLGVFEGDEVLIFPPESLLLPPGELPTYEKVVVKSLLSTEMADIDSQFIFYNLGQSLVKFRSTASRESGIEVYVDDQNKMEGLKAELEGLGAHVETWQTRNAILFFALKLEKYAMTTFLGLSVLITSFSIFTVLVLLLTQKRKDLGVLMALGYSPKRAKRLFTGIGLILTFLGLGGGLILGSTIVYLIDLFPVNILPDIYYDSSIPAELDPILLMSVFVGALIIALIASWVPVHLHTKWKPVELLKGR